MLPKRKDELSPDNKKKALRYPEAAIRDAHNEIIH